MLTGVMPDGGLSGSGHNMGTYHACIPVVSLGGVTAGIVGSTGPSSGSAMGAVTVVTACRIL